MNKIFKLPTKHHVLQYIIQVFASHPLPSLTQQINNNAQKIQASTIWEVPNCNFTLPPIRKNTEQNVVDSSIPRHMNLQWWVYSCFQKTTSFPLIVMLFRHLKWDRLLNNLTIVCCIP